MPDIEHDLLKDPIVSLRLHSGEPVKASLSEVLTRLCDGTCAELSALRPHQAHPVHALLVQLAAMALGRSQTSQRPETLRPDDWSDRLIQLAGGRREPFCLVVNDLSKPAFMQPPVPEGTLDALKGEVLVPDLLDMLVTTRNHDVKSARLAAARPEHWLYALLTLQTMEGFSGRDNYGIARMNSGYGNRPCVAYAPSLDLSVRFRRDLDVLLRHRNPLLSSHGYTDTGIALLWLLPWDGKTSLDLAACDPYFIEVCRRVRLVATGPRLHARTASSKVPRLAAEERHGDTGDPWTPVDRAKGTGLTVPAAGFTYTRIQELLVGGDFRPGMAGQIYPEDGRQLVFVATAMTRGQGKTEGLHQRVLDIGPRARTLLSIPAERERLSNLARRRVEAADLVRTRVLRPALCMLLQGGPDKPDFRDERTARFTDALDQDIDQIYFERLFRDLDAAPHEADRLWAEELCELARSQLHRATGQVPLASMRRYRAEAAAFRMFESLARKHFPSLYQTDPASAPSTGEAKAQGGNQP